MRSLSTAIVIGSGILAACSDSTPTRVAPPTDSAAPVAIAPVALAADISFTNEPSGLTVLSDRSFDSIIEAGWANASPSGGVSTVSDVRAPASPPSVLRVHYPAGMSGGASPWASSMVVQNGATTLYTSLWVEVSNNFVGHSSGSNKIMYFWAGGVIRAALLLQGAGSGALVPRVALYNSVSPAASVLAGNVAPSAAFSRGAWHRLELVLTTNTAGNADGVIEWWMDGAKIGSYERVNMVGTAARAWEVVKIDPVWGGMRGAIATAQYLDVDHIRVSGGVAATVPASVPMAVASVTVTLDSASVTQGSGTQATATARDASGVAISGRAVTWTSTNPAVATVSSTGVVTAVAPGTASIVATVDGVTGSSTLTVSAPPAAPVASITVSLAPDTLSVGGTARATAIVRDANGNVLTDRAVTWSSSNPGVATVAASGSITGVAAGTASIIATADGAQGADTLTVQAPSGGGDGGSQSTLPNQPTGMTAITQSKFGSLTEGGWAPYYNISLGTDASAPSAPSVVQLRYPAGFSGGGSPGLLEHALPGGSRTLYMSFWTKYSTNWYGHASVVNKVNHVWIGGINRVVVAAAGTGTGPLRPQIRLQQIASHGGYVNFDPNLAPRAQVVRGRWHHWEVVLKANSAGGADGSVEWWLDGVKVGSVGGIQYVAGAGTWDLIKFDPTWGGMGGTVPADQYLWLDDVFISGKP